jgi:hypothetical protein
MGLTMCAEDRKCNFVGEIYTKSDLVRRKEKKILSLENKLEKLKRELNNLK